jgi:hypothetical protein
VREGDVLCGITTHVDGETLEFPVDNHGLVKVPWSMSKIELCNLDFTLFCDRKKTFVTYLTKKGKKYVPRRRRLPICVRRRRLDMRIPFWEDIPYILVGGIVFMDLCENHLKDMRKGSRPLDARVLLHLIESHADEHALCIPYVYPQSIVDDTEAINKYSIVTHVNGTEVTTVKECDRELKKAVRGSFIRIDTEGCDNIVLKTANLRVQDALYASTLPGYPVATLLTTRASKRPVETAGRRRSKRLRT